MLEDCTGEHVWESDVFPKDGEWYGCKKCQVLGKLVKGKIEPIKCIDCDNLAITLNKRKAGEPSVPVCQYCFTGIMIL